MRIDLTLDDVTVEELHLVTEAFETLTSGGKYEVATETSADGHSLDFWRDEAHRSDLRNLELEQELVRLRAELQLARTPVKPNPFHVNTVDGFVRTIHSKEK